MDPYHKPQILLSFNNCPPDMKRNVMQIFRGMGPNCNSIILLDARDYPFPWKAVDDYLSKNPEKVRKVTELNLEFSKRNSVQLLEMVRKRFPNLKSINLPQAFTHPIGHVLNQYAQMPHLETVHFCFSVYQLEEYGRSHRLTPLPQVKSLYSCMVGTADTYEQFEVTLPIIFPNLESLHYLGPGDEFAEKIYGNAKRLFPKMKFCKVVDSTEIPAIVHEQENPRKFPINVTERLN